MSRFDYHLSIPLHSDDLDWETHGDNALNRRVSEIEEWLKNNMKQDYGVAFEHSRHYPQSKGIHAVSVWMEDHRDYIIGKMFWN